MDYLLHLDDSLNIEMVQVSLDLKYLRLPWILILFFNFIPCCLSKVIYRVMTRYILRCSKVVE